MKTIACIIVDDEPLAVKLLESFVSRTPQLRLERSFTDSVEALGWLKEHRVDLVLMDIQMPDLNGMELSRILSGETKVIFTTAFKEYAFESYEVSAVDFLLKPIRYNKFVVAIEKAERLIGLENKPEPADTTAKKTMFIRIDGELRQVNLGKILYVEGMKDYVRFYVEGEARPLTTHMTMKALRKPCPPTRSCASTVHTSSGWTRYGRSTATSVFTSVTRLSVSPMPTAKRSQVIAREIADRCASQMQGLGHKHTP